MEKKRLTAQIANAKEVVNGKYVQQEGFTSNYVVTTLGRKVSRVRIMGLIVDKFISEDSTYGAITIDDGSDTIRCKIFVSTKMLETLNPGDLVDVTGKLREYNEEIYVMPEIIRKVDADAETLRMLELKRIQRNQADTIRKVRKLQKSVADISELKAVAKGEGIESEKVEAIVEAQGIIDVEEEQKTEKKGEARGKVLKIIETQDNGNGVDYHIILEKSGLPEEQVDSAIQELLESGVCFEPRAGKIKKI